MAAVSRVTDTVCVCAGLSASAMVTDENGVAVAVSLMVVVVAMPPMLGASLTSVTMSVTFSATDQLPAASRA